MGTLVTTMLTAERLCEVLHYEPDTGEFTWRVTHRAAVEHFGEFAVLNFGGSP
jgi:hypothetical protein